MSLPPRQSHVLVVDDDPVVLEALSGMMSLRLPDLTVDTASSGEAALSRLRRRVYDVLVTDLLMPGMTGLHLMEEVAAFECPPAMLLMTAHLNPAGSTLCGHGFALEADRSRALVPGRQRGKKQGEAHEGSTSGRNRG